jgi:DNA-directed RNA polymerase specialized sigma subunit
MPGLFSTPGYEPPGIAPTSYLEPNFAPHYNAWKQNPTPETTGNLLRAVDPVINEAIRTYGGSAAKSPTLKGKARKLTISTLGSYDPTRAKLRTHLLSQLQGLRRISAQEEQILNIPEQVLLDLGGLRESENRLRDRLGRDPSDMELADHTGLSRKRINYLRTMRPSFSEGRLVRVDDEGTSMNMPAVEQTAPTGALQAWHDFVYHDLDPIDQQIMEYTLGMHGKPQLSNQDVARLLRLSPGAISQRKARIQSKLDQHQATGLF